MKPEILLAKTSPVQTISEHTDDLLENLKILKEHYKSDIEKIVTLEDKELFWTLLEIAIYYHDTGKSFINTQNKLRENLKKNKIKDNDKKFENIRHNWLSPGLIDISSIPIKDRELIIVLMQSILSHHSRITKYTKSEIKSHIDDIFKNDLSNKIDLIETHLDKGYKVRRTLNSSYIDIIFEPINIKHKYFKEYILLTGLLQRLDHTSSAKEIIEINSKHSIGDNIILKLIKLRDLQKFCLKNNNKNIILIGSAGIGKTEAALLWIGKDKGFFTLPFKMSTNAIYDRVKRIYNYDYVGLLHSSALEFLDNSYDIEDSSLEINQTRLLSKKITISTIDQLLKFPLFYPGYEKVYATLSYSKIVIDELQAYDADIVAIIIRAIELVHKFGGKFMIITATMPSIYTDKLKELGVFDSNLMYKTFTKNEDRHKVEIKDMSIIDNIDTIINQSKNEKVLVYANTISSAIDIYKEIQRKAKDINSVNLLHSRFIKKDKQRLEIEIQTFSNQKNKSGIWITTNLAESSLDIDFNKVHTEMCTIDSLIQRMGRCNRKWLDKLIETNIFIYKISSGIGSVYDKEITLLSEKALSKHLAATLGTINEADKNYLVEKIYSYKNIKNTKFYNRFKSTFSYLNSMAPYEVTSAEAQNILRKINTYKIIPKPIFEKIKDSVIINLIKVINLLDDNKKLTSKEGNALILEKKHLLSEIDKYTVELNSYNIDKDKLTTIKIDKYNCIKILDCDYDFKIGVIL